jgi:hypothetical protein
MYNLRDDGLYFWHTKPQMDLQEGPIPTITSNKQDILLGNCPLFDATVTHTYVESDWATQPNVGTFGRNALVAATQF